MTKREARRMRGLARRFAALWRRAREADAAKKTVAERLKPLMLETQSIAVPAGDFDGAPVSVYFEADARKEPTKADLVAFFGAERAEAFWEQVKPRASSWLTVKPAAKQKAAV